jgi:hypothetical protein
MTGEIQLNQPIGIYYEHPDWFRPLFEQLDARGIAWQKIEARNHTYGFDEKDVEYSLIFNRMSPSAWQRGLAHCIFYTLGYLAHLEAQNIRVVNGLRAFTNETSKARQLDLLHTLQLPFPRARVIHHASQALEAAREIGYPLVIKPNIGGSGAGIVRFSNPVELQCAVDAGSLQFGIDSTALVQRYFQARDSVITRVEVLGYKYLYAIQIHTTGETFDLCPADICQNTRGEELVRSACPVDAPKTGLKVEGYQPPKKIISEVEQIMRVAGIEVGGIEYAIDKHTGELMYYDINALSNFVADPNRVVGFNPYSRLADYLVAEAQQHEAQQERGVEAQR